MASYTYRYQNLLNWQSTSGNAIFAIVNPLSSQKIITVRSIEINPITSARSVQLIRIARVSSSSINPGEPVPIAKFNSQSPDLPSTISITRNCSVSVGSTTTLFSSLYWWNMVSPAAAAPAPLSSFLCTNCGRIANSFNYQIQGRNSYLQNITLNQNEGLCVIGSIDTVVVPVIIDMQFRYIDKLHAGTHIYSTSFFAMLGGTTLSPIGVINTSSNKIKINSLNITPAGTTDTPYFKIVPVGAIVAEVLNCSLNKIAPDQLVKLDSQNPTLTEDQIMIFKDAPIIPYGVPVEYASTGGTATPKGANYLHTRDFLGPDYGVFFPEVRTSSVGTGRDDLGFTISKKYSRIKENIILRPGEGIGVVSAAETLASWGGTSGWTVLFGFDLIVSDIEYTLTLTNIVPGSEVRIFEAGTTNELAGTESVGEDGQFVYSYVYEPDFYVDIVIHNVNYIYYRLNHVKLTASNMTIPVSQQVDRQYSNPPGGPAP